MDRYYFYVNEERLPADLKRQEVKQVIYEFYKEHFPNYLKDGIPEDLTDVNILDCFEVFNMPDYRPKHAFPGLVTLEDIRNGNIHDEDKPRFSFRDWNSTEESGGRRASLRWQITRAIPLLTETGRAPAIKLMR